MLSTRMRMSGAADFYPYKINQSCRFNDDDSAYLSYTPDSGMDDDKKQTHSFWIKRNNIDIAIGVLTAGAAAQEDYFLIDATDNFVFVGNNGSFCNYHTTQVFRDVGSWYHFHIKIDTTQATASDRVIISINGETVTSFSTETNPGLNATMERFLANTLGQYIGRLSSQAIWYGEFYLAEFHALDGIASDVTNFGQSKSGVWVPKKYTGSHGTNGFYLDFADSGDLGNDVSGNDNDFTPSGLAADDQVLDSPTNNYPTMNNVVQLINTGASYRNGNLEVTCGTPDYAVAPATFNFPDSGKWYIEIKNGAGNHRTDVGIVEYPESNLTSGVTGDGHGIRCETGKAGADVFYRELGVVGSDFNAAWDVGEIYAIAVDMDNGKVWFGLDNLGETLSWDGDPEAGTGNEISITPSKNWIFAVSNWSSGDNMSLAINFGQLGFTHTPPTGFKALNSENIAKPVIKDSSTGFGIITYEATGAELVLSGLNFNPSSGSMVWFKGRDYASNHSIFDTVRGATEVIYSDLTNAEGTQVQSLKSFNSDGGTIGTFYNVSNNGFDFVSWWFRMGAKYGFDIQTYEGTGVAHAENHNLGGVPELMIVKNRDLAGTNWATYHHHALNKIDPETDVGYLNLNNTWVDDNTKWNDTAPTPTQFTVGVHNSVNENEDNHVAYLWRSIPQFSKVFSYEGNANANGPFVYCGFRPRYVLIKSADTSGSNWFLFDSERNTYNGLDRFLRPDLSAVEGSGTNFLDFISNGFKIRTTNADVNTNNHTIVGIAYAEQPGKWSNAR